MERNYTKLTVNEIAKDYELQSIHARKRGVSPEYICRLVRNGKLKSLNIEEFNLKLVEKYNPAKKEK